MATVMAPSFGAIHIPGWVNDLNSFRRWVHSGVLPEKLPVHFIHGEVWVDLHMEELFSHNQVKAAVYRLLGGIAEDEHLGLFMPDGMLVTNDDAGLGAEPDGMFASDEAIESGRVRFVAAETTGAEATEIIGTPDMVLEVVSPSSVKKDTDRLMGLYFDAGIPEYWLIDARGGEIRFDIFHRGPNGYTPVQTRDEWVRSEVFGRSFRLTRGAGRRGLARYKLEAR